MKMSDRQAYFKAYRQLPESKEKRAKYNKAYSAKPENKAKKAAYDKARRATTEYKEKELVRRSTKEFKQMNSLKNARYYARLQELYPEKHQAIKEKKAARRSIPENKAKKAAYDRARRQRMKEKQGSLEAAETDSSSSDSDDGSGSEDEVRRRVRLVVENIRAEATAVTDTKDLE